MVRDSRMFDNSASTLWCRQLVLLKYLQGSSGAQRCPWYLNRLSHFRQALYTKLAVQVTCNGCLQEGAGNFPTTMQFKIVGSAGSADVIPVSCLKSG